VQGEFSGHFWRLKVKKHTVKWIMDQPTAESQQRNSCIDTLDQMQPRNWAAAGCTTIRSRHMSFQIVILSLFLSNHLRSTGLGALKRKIVHRMSAWRLFPSHLRHPCPPKLHQPTQQVYVQVSYFNHHRPQHIRASHHPSYRTSRDIDS
jgi:hypothetical protein